MYENYSSCPCLLLIASIFMKMPLFYFSFPKLFLYVIGCTYLYLNVCNRYQHYSSCTCMHLIVNCVILIAPGWTWLHIIVPIWHWLHILVPECMNIYQHYMTCTWLHLIASICNCLHIHVSDNKGWNFSPYLYWSVPIFRFA